MALLALLKNHIIVTTPTTSLLIVLGFVDLLYFVYNFNSYNFHVSLIALVDFAFRFLINPGVDFPKLNQVTHTAYP